MELKVNENEQVQARDIAFLLFLTLLNVINFIDRQLLISFANWIKPELDLSNFEFGLLAGLVFMFFYIHVVVHPSSGVRGRKQEGDQGKDLLPSLPRLGHAWKALSAAILSKQETASHYLASLRTRPQEGQGAQIFEIPPRKLRGGQRAIGHQVQPKRFSGRAHRAGFYL